MKGNLTTQTPLPPEGFFGLAGHIGLVGKCSGKLNSNSGALRSWFRFEAAAAAVDFEGMSHHSLRRPPARSSNGSMSSFRGRGVPLGPNDEADSEPGCCWSLGPLTSKKRPRGFPSATSSFSGGVFTRVAFYSGYD